MVGNWIMPLEKPFQVHVLLMLKALSTSVRIHEKRKSETELSKHIWQLKGENKEFKVTWKILAKAKPYTNGVIFFSFRV